VALQNGQMVNSEGSLAGAHITMPQPVSRFINHLSIAPAQALKMATSVPAGQIQS
jgi:N-acetylglucosamine-6-phosphate deacetylase